MFHFPSRFASVPTAVVALTLLVACSSPPNDSDNPDSTRTSNSEPSRSDSGKGTPPSSPGGGQEDSDTTPPSDAATADEPSEDAPDRLGAIDSDDPDRSESSAGGQNSEDDGTRKGARADVRIAPNLPTRDEAVLNGRRMVALYGAPSTPSLGALGEQSLDKSIKRVKRLAKAYSNLTKDDVVPTFEIIASVASANGGGDGDFSSELDLSTLRPWVERAAKEGVYVVLDLQPGRNSFVRQAKRYAPLLKYPHVGLALDPEWRLGPKQRHLEQIGSVDAKEVNATIDWLAGLTHREDLPQKLLVLHQFRTSMIDGRKNVRTDRENVSVLVHADGQGTQAAKRGTWRSLLKGAPRGVQWGWKNFLDEDHPTLTPRQTYQVHPKPDFVSYQ